MALETLLWMACAYLCGSIPFGLLLVRAVSGTDVRLQGSGNIGATNAMRATNKWVGIATLALDGLKGFLPVYCAAFYGMPLEIQTLLGLVAFLGHCFPIWLRFKGGKGVATGLGVGLGLFPTGTLIGVLAFAVVLLIARRASIASIFAACTVVVLACLWMGSRVEKCIFAAMVVILVARHGANIRRFLKGEEPALW